MDSESAQATNEVRRPAAGRGPRLRQPISLAAAVFFAALSVALCFRLWWFLTAGEDEERIMSPAVLPSPRETFAEFRSLWFDRALTRNTFVTLRRVAFGFGLARLVGVPLGVLCGCFSLGQRLPRARGDLRPQYPGGRPDPADVLAFRHRRVAEDHVHLHRLRGVHHRRRRPAAIGDVSSRYVDTAYTLGANRWQMILKVLVPLAMPSIFNSPRLLFGLAFGYIMLAEVIRFGNEAGGLGDIINLWRSAAARASTSIWSS